MIRVLVYNLNIKKNKNKKSVSKIKKKVWVKANQIKSIIGREKFCVTLTSHYKISRLHENMPN